MKKKWHYYVITKSFRANGYDFKEGDLVGYFLPIRLPHIYKKEYMKILDSPIYK